jgi:hypothetical protein
MVDLQDYEAVVNITWGGANGELPDPVRYEASDAEIRQWAAEAIRGGSVPGIRADAGADLSDFMIERYASNDEVSYNRIFVRPKTPFGA